jgi:SAM-dependent methyltransferase
MGPDPKAFVLGCADLLRAGGSALDLACGEGQTAVWLAQRGYSVLGVDLSAVGLAKARARAAAADLDVELLQADLDDWDPGDRQWDVVLCIHFLSRDLIPRIRRAVRPGGLLVAEVLAEGGGHSPRFVAAPNELLRWFVDWRVLRYEETPSDRPVAAIAARKP